MTAHAYDAIVVGGGLHGLSAALHLAKAGLRPVVLEKDHVGRHASGVNAGGVRRLGRHLAEVPLSESAMHLWHDIEDLVADDCGFVRCGQIKVAENAAELEELEHRAAQVRALGFQHEEIIGQHDLRQWVPSVAPHCVGAMLCRDDGAANPYRTVVAFARRAREYGATIHEGHAVKHIHRKAELWKVQSAGRQFEAPVLVNAAGAWSAQMAAAVGDKLPMEAVAPMLMITERVPPFIKPVIGAAGRTLSFKQYKNGTVLIGGGYLGKAEPEHNRASVDLRTLSASASTVTALFPRLKQTRIVRSWAGLEGRMADGIPVLGASAQADQLYYSFGYSAHGYQLAPITGHIITQLIMHGESDLPISAFRSNRFTNEPSVFAGD